MPNTVFSIGYSRGLTWASALLLLIATPNLAIAETNAEIYAEIMRTRMDAIVVLASKAHELCAPLPNMSDMPNKTISTDFNAEAGIKIAKTFEFIGEAGASAAIKHNTQSIIGVSQAAMADLLKDRGNCPSNFVIRMAPLILISPSTK